MFVIASSVFSFGIVRVPRLPGEKSLELCLCLLVQLYDGVVI